MRRRDGFDFLAFHFLLDHGESTLAVLVGIALGSKSAEDIFSIKLIRLRLSYRVEVADFIFEKQKMQNQAALDRADQNQTFLVVKDRLRERDAGWQLRSTRKTKGAGLRADALW